jgi:haloacetate dehalogenase
MKRPDAVNPLGSPARIPMQLYGAGPPVILLHGCPTTPRSLEPLARRLARTHRVVVPDLVQVDVGFTEALDLLVAALRAADITRAAVVGHSGGTYRAFQLALDGRIEVTRLVGLGPIACITPTPPIPNRFSSVTPRPSRCGGMKLRPCS